MPHLELSWPHASFSCLLVVLGHLGICQYCPMSPVRPFLCVNLSSCGIISPCLSQASLNGRQPYWINHLPWLAVVLSYLMACARILCPERSQSEVLERQGEGFQHTFWDITQSIIGIVFAIGSDHQVWWCTSTIPIVRGWGRRIASSRPFWAALWSLISITKTNT